MKKKIKFYEKSHIYKVGKNKLTSVTTFLGEYFKKFDANAVAKFKAMQSRRAGIKGQGVRYWKAQWKESAEHGSRVHKAIEEFILNGDFVTAFEEKDRKKVEAGLKILEVLPLGDLKTEEIIFDEELGLAGTIDLLIEHKGNKVSLYDWKTNKAIIFDGYRGAKAKTPINHLPDCNFSKYSLQLSTYAYMLEQQGKEIEDLRLVHLTDDGPVVHRVPYLKDEVKELIKHEKETKER